MNQSVSVVDHELGVINCKNVISDCLDTLDIMTTNAKQSICGILEVIEIDGTLVQVLEIKLFSKFVEPINPVIFSSLLLTFIQIFL